MAQERISMNESVGARRRGRFVLRPVSALLERFGRDRKAAVAVEFGIIVLPFFAVVFTVFEMSLLFLTGQAFDTALDQAARQLLTGQAQTSTGTQAINSMTTFMQYAFCPTLPTFITCSQVKVNVAKVASFGAVTLGPPISNGTLDTSSWGYSPCASGTIMKIEAIYPVPALTSFWASQYTVTVSGTKQRVLYSSSVFQCEPFSS